MLQVGVILRAHGIRGELRVRVESDSLSTLERVYIAGREHRVVRVRPDKEDLLIQLEGIADRNAAEALRGQTIHAPREDLPPPDPGEHYVADLIGCKVYDSAGRFLGEVTGSFFSGAHETLEVKGEREFLLPFIAPIVTQVDVAARRIVCDPPPGLIE
jgi:16S rRNA processing protein RimM